MKNLLLLYVLIGLSLVSCNEEKIVYSLSETTQIPDSLKEQHRTWILPQVPPVVFLLLSLAMFIYGLWVLLPWTNREDSTEKSEEIPAPPKKRAPKREGK